MEGTTSGVAPTTPCSSADPRPPADRGARRGARAVVGGLVAATVLAAGVLAAGCGSPPPPSGIARQYSSPKAIARPEQSAALAGRRSSRARTTAAGRMAATSGPVAPISAPGGPYLRDGDGRVVMLHGVNATYKRAPYELYPDPGRPWNFSSADATAIAGLGFDVVRLGILWEGLEPGHGGANQPGICTPGPPGDPHMFDRAVADAYLARVAQTVDLLARHGVYTILDMHQDVYSGAFDGEGAPPWAVCTNGQPIVTATGRWSRNYRDPTLRIATDHFWDNDVVGDLQGQFDLVWSTVAGYFRHDPWVLGFDPYNEPFSSERTPGDALAFAVDLQCFYAGRARPGHLAGGSGQLHCPPTDPAVGVIGTIERADPGRLVLAEPDIYTSQHVPNLLGPMPYPDLVLNFHSYCRLRSPVTGEPTDTAACAAEVLTTLLARERERPLLSTPEQRGGPAWFLSEFGAADEDTAFIDQVTGYADLLGLGWAYWSWKYYDDPTGSSQEALASPDGRLAPVAGILSRPYPEAVAGTPESVLFDPPTDHFEMTYAADRRITAPTVIFVGGRLHYPRTGYCATVDGGRIVSAPGAARLVVADDPQARTVSVDLSPGRCRGAR
ncbi:MAG: cellulase family glycosylhydrolase [Acidimicrobiales bacterium]